MEKADSNSYRVLIDEMTKSQAKLLAGAGLVCVLIVTGIWWSAFWVIELSGLIGHYVLLFGVQACGLVLSGIGIVGWAYWCDRRERITFALLLFVSGLVMAYFSNVHGPWISFIPIFIAAWTMTAVTLVMVLVGQDHVASH